MSVSDCVRYADMVPEYKKFDICMVELSEPEFGSYVQGGYRPAVIVSNDMCNRFSQVMTVVPLTSQRKKYLPRAAHRKTELLPHITNHTLRHSFCTRLMETGTNLKVIQQIMGHADFSTTMDIYTDVSERFKQRSVEKIQGNMCLG